MESRVQVSYFTSYILLFATLQWIYRLYNPHVIHISCIFISEIIFPFENYFYILAAKFNGMKFTLLKSALLLLLVLTFVSARTNANPCGYHHGYCRWHCCGYGDPVCKEKECSKKEGEKCAHKGDCKESHCAGSHCGGHGWRGHCGPRVWGHRYCESGCRDNHAHYYHHGHGDYYYRGGGN